MGGCAGVYHMGHATSSDGLQWTGTQPIPRWLQSFCWGLFTTAAWFLRKMAPSSSITPAPGRTCSSDADGGFITGDGAHCAQPVWDPGGHQHLMDATSPPTRAAYGCSRWKRHQTSRVPIPGIPRPPRCCAPMETWRSTWTWCPADPMGALSRWAWRAVSADGLNFGPEELDPTVFGVGNGGWTNGEILAPTVVYMEQPAPLVCRLHRSFPGRRLAAALGTPPNNVFPDHANNAVQPRWYMVSTAAPPSPRLCCNATRALGTTLTRLTTHC